MTTPARYPTYHEVRVRIDAMYGCVTQAPSPTQMIDIIRHAIDIERERVAKEAGEYFRCDECHEPAGTRQVCRRCVRLEIESDDAVEAQNSAVKVPDDGRRWILCTERMPLVGQQVWYYFDVVGVHYGKYVGGHGFAGRNGFLMGDVTHWMEAPTPPTEPAIQSLTHPTETPR